MADDTGAKLFRIRRTVVEMLVDRGYLLSEEDQNMDLDTFKEKFGGGNQPVRRDDMYLLQPKQDDPTQQIIVFFPDSPKVGLGEVKKVTERMQETKAQCGIVVLQAQMTPQAKQVSACSFTPPPKCV